RSFGVLAVLGNQIRRLRYNKWKIGCARRFVHMASRALTAGLVLALGALCILSFASETEAHHAVLRFNLEEMTMAANRIFLGKCVSVDETTESLAGGEMAVTHYTFQVQRAIKGSLPAVITFTQLGHSAKAAKGGAGEITMHGQAVTPSTF